MDAMGVPAVNKSTLGVDSALVKLVSGIESKRSTNTCAPKDRNIKMLKHYKTVITHSSQVEVKDAFNMCTLRARKMPVNMNKSKR